MKHRDYFDSQRRQLMKLGLYGSAYGALASFLPGVSFAAREESSEGKILVVLELSGGNDGLNTIIPYGDDAYYALRPKLGVKKDELLQLDNMYGMNPGMVGLQKLYNEGRVAIIHGAGYPQPSFSHFNSMAYWHTAAPNSGESYGWVGRLADVLIPEGTPNAIINVNATQSLAVRSRKHVPIVFNDPGSFSPKGSGANVKGTDGQGTNSSRAFLNDVARGASRASQQVKRAWANYGGGVDYGLNDLDLPKIASLIEARMPTRLYYTSFRDNAFDTHVNQPNLHRRLLTYFSDAVRAFMLDMDRIGRADDVLLLVFSEFGRRPGENSNLGSDHGTSNVMFAVGNPVKGGHHGVQPSLTNLDETENLHHTVDFRQVLATVIDDWLGYAAPSDVLGGDYSKIPLL
jgi:uncharacterized protein (DUF1501 family)